MPIVNVASGKELTYKVSSAESFRGRLIGLLGTSTPDPGKCLLFESCKGIHTIGMSYPVDVVFLDSEGMVIEVIRDLIPNKITKPVPGARSVLEVPSGEKNGNEIHKGDRLKITADELHRPGLTGLKKLLHWPVNISMALLWSMFVLSSVLNWHQNGGISSGGLVFVNTLLVVLFLTRRESKDTSHRILDWVIPITTVGASLMLRSNPIANTPILALSVVMQSVGIMAIVISLLSLGKSFGIIPANRGIKDIGMYKFVRHPLYASEILFYCGFVIGNASLWNVFLVCLVLFGQIYRSLSEEKLLGKEYQYGEYMGNVKYRFVPGIF